ncbi:MAG TPA: TAXI family TRAP transporter solute-binding subunit [Thermodesulfobacteriota bacterium]
MIAALLCLLAWTAVVAGASPAAAATSSEPQWVRQLALGSTQQSSSAYPFYVALANVINKNVPNTNATVQETGASVDNIRQLARGSIHLGLVTMDTAFQAYNATGGGPFKAAGPQRGLRTMFIYDMGPQYYVVRADSGVTDLAQLTGKRWSPGFSGSATETITKLLFRELNIKPDYYEGSLDDITSAIQDGTIIGYAKGGAMRALDASILTVSTTVPLRMLAFSPSQVNALREKLPYVNWVTIPESVVKTRNISSDGGEYQTWGVVTSVAAWDTLAQDQAYAIVKAAVEQKAALERAYPRTKAFDLVEDTLKYSTVPLHAGMVQYLAERGVEVPKALVPPEYRPVRKGN